MPSPDTMERRILEASCALEASADVLVVGNGGARVERGPVGRYRPYARSLRRAKRAAYARLLAAELGCARGVARRTAFAGAAARAIQAMRRRKAAARDGATVTSEQA